MIVYVLFAIAALIGLLSPFDISASVEVCNPFVVPSIIGAGASLLGSIFDSFGQSSTNQMNYNIAKENRAWQSLENDKARSWEEKMWNETNAYNTPAAMMQRYSDAGLNPYLSGQIGQGASLPSSPSLSGAPSTPLMQNPLASLGQGIANAGQSLGNMMMQGEMYKSQIGLNNAKELNEVMDGLSKIWTDLSPSQREVAWKNLYSKYGDFADVNGRSSRLDNMLSDSYMKSMQGELSRLQSDLQSKLNHGGIAERQLWKYDQDFTESAARIGKMASDVSVNEVNKSVMNQQIKTLCNQAKLFYEEARKAGADADTLLGIKEYVIKQAEYSALSSGLNFSDLYASWAENEHVRKYMESSTAKGRAKDIYTYQKHVWRSALSDLNSTMQSLPVRGSFGSYTTNNHSVGSNTFYNGNYNPPVGIRGFGQ